jgi:8-oxo-dGTP diphosphatase
MDVRSRLSPAAPQRASFAAATPQYPGYEDGNYSVIAGHVDPGERVTQALVREAAEEAGIQLNEEEVHFVHVIQRQGADGPVYLDFFFLAEHWQGQVQNCEPPKCDGCRSQTDGF